MRRLRTKKKIDIFEPTPNLPFLLPLQTKSDNSTYKPSPSTRTTLYDPTAATMVYKKMHDAKLNASWLSKVKKGRQFSSRPYPTCCISRGVPIMRPISALKSPHHHGGKEKSTLGRLTFGTTTECSALGASLGGFLASPPGWYLYLSNSQSFTLKRYERRR